MTNMTIWLSQARPSRKRSIIWLRAVAAVADDQPADIDGEEAAGAEQLRPGEERERAGERQDRVKARRRSLSRLISATQDTAAGETRPPRRR